MQCFMKKGDKRVMMCSCFQDMTPFAIPLTWVLYKILKVALCLYLSSLVGFRRVHYDYGYK